ncbi:PTS ascorbate transporter subunit IIC [Alicyclobacillus shizuokensis]|uniref:PTS ascorbate transporter subunit IIC n=1 Tax=Alicyclobacillus shizuokensis TaxID=392014 RepID=UPI0008369AD8|nr:PTS ascorbate transporter subunit IIC [Alicyclobacillus shizuokensis]MCL6625334.1 PTS ascorbate transporter subunit IIC [Alicyclobacillus shizuokensis]
MVVIHFIVHEILDQAPLLVGLIALIGLIALRKSFSETVTGTLKVIVGFLILSGGANIISGALAPLGNMVQAGFHLHGVIPTNEAIVGLAQKAFGPQTAVIMGLGFVVNLLLARFTRAKFIFLTGHHMFFMATVLAVVLGSAGITGTNQTIIGAILAGTVSTIMPAFVHPFTKKVTGGAEFALGHFNTLGYITSAAVGKLVGGNSRTTEEIKVSPKFGFLRDSLVMTTLTMIVLFLILAIVAGPKAIASYTQGGNYIMYAFTQALTFGAGIAVVLMGVRMILAEIIPAFQGIAQKIVPNAVPALDCPTVFPFAPTAVLVGFISSLVGGIVGMFLMGPLGLALIIPGMVPHFFDGGTAGVYGNATGGRRGAMIGAFINGLLITVLPALLLAFMGSFGLANTTFGDSDFCWVGIVGGLFAKTGLAGAYILTIVVCAILVLLASYVTKRTSDQPTADDSVQA